MELDTEDVAQILLTAGHFLRVDGIYHDIEDFERRAIEAYSLLFGQEDSRTLTGMNNLVETYRALGRTKEAAALHEKVLNARRGCWARTLGKEHLDRLLSMNNLAETYRALGWTKEAAVLHERVLDARTRTLGEEHPYTLASM